MLLRQSATCLLLAGLLVLPALTKAEDTPPAGIQLELNTAQDTANACRLTFVAENSLGTSVEKAVFETVIFDVSGGVVLLSLFDFRDLPQGALRVRQFDVPAKRCGEIGRVLINDAHTCSVSGADSDVCRTSLSANSRIDMELIR
ncbi:MAG: hypothetical protein AB3N13_08480 [Arenibacterium sp.]